jgi:hypothetical protein
MVEMKKGTIRTDCYYAVLDKFKKEYPDAHFECAMRQWFSSVLSPTWDLLNAAKTQKWPIEDYYAALGRQIRHDPVALARLEFLRDLVRKGKTVFIVCVEKDASICHRTLIKELIERGL